MWDIFLFIVSLSPFQKKYEMWTSLLQTLTFFVVLFLLQKNYRQQPYTFKHTSVADSPDIVHAKLSGQITNEVGR